MAISTAENSVMVVNWGRSAAMAAARMEYPSERDPREFGVLRIMSILPSSMSSTTFFPMPPTACSTLTAASGSESTRVLILSTIFESMP